MALTASLNHSGPGNRGRRRGPRVSNYDTTPEDETKIRSRLRFRDAVVKIVDQNSLFLVDME